MALPILFQTSFDHYTTVTQRFNSTRVSGGSITITSSGRRSSNGLQCSLGASAIGNVADAAVKTIANGGGAYLAFAFTINSLPPSPNTSLHIASFEDTGSIQLGLRLLNNGQLRIARGNFSSGTILNTSTLSILPNVFYHMEWFIGCGTTGSTILKVNEVQWASFSGDTDQTNTGIINGFSIGLNNSTWGNDGVNLGSLTAVYDDCIVRNDTWSGDLAVGLYLPVGNGSTNQWTVVGASNAYQAVDETAPNSNTDYVAGSTVGDIQLFTYGTISSTSEIHAIIPVPFAEKTDAGTATFASIALIGSTTYVGETKAPSAGSYEFHPDPWNTSPATGITWTTTEFNNIQIGVKRIS